MHLKTLKNNLRNLKKMYGVKIKIIEFLIPNKMTIKPVNKKIIIAIKSNFILNLVCPVAFKKLAKGKLKTVSSANIKTTVTVFVLTKADSEKIKTTTLSKKLYKIIKGKTIIII